MLFGKNKNEIAVPTVKSKQVNILIFLGYVVLGGYFINKQFNLLTIPEIIAKFDNWIILVGGLFLILGAFHYYKASK